LLVSVSGSLLGEQSTKHSGNQVGELEHLQKLLEIWRNNVTGCVLVRTSSLLCEKQQGF